MQHQLCLVIAIHISYVRDRRIQITQNTPPELIKGKTVKATLVGPSNIQLTALALVALRDKAQQQIQR